jgi:hypothetical protein
LVVHYRHADDLLAFVAQEPHAPLPLLSPVRLLLYPLSTWRVTNEPVEILNASASHDRLRRQRYRRKFGPHQVG